MSFSLGMTTSAAPPRAAPRQRPAGFGVPRFDVLEDDARIGGRLACAARRELATLEAWDGPDDAARWRQRPFVHAMEAHHKARASAPCADVCGERQACLNTKAP